MKYVLLNLYLQLATRPRGLMKWVGESPHNPTDKETYMTPTESESYKYLKSTRCQYLPVFSVQSGHIRSHFYIFIIIRQHNTSSFKIYFSFDFLANLYPVNSKNLGTNALAVSIKKLFGAFFVYCMYLSYMHCVHVGKFVQVRLELGNLL